MTVMWIIVSLLVFPLVLYINFLYARPVGVCVILTNLALLNSVVKDKFADENFLKELQKIIVAEPGANNRHRYLSLFLQPYLI